MRAKLILAAVCVSSGLPLLAACAAPPPGPQYAQADQQPSGPPPGYAGWGSYGQQGAGQPPPPPPGAGAPQESGPGGPPPYSQPPGGPGPGGMAPPGSVGGMAPPGAVGGMAPPGAVGPNGQLRGEARFEAANVAHDGRLTLAQAEAAHWMVIVHNFSRIDRDQKGYVTWQDIREFQREMHAERMQQQAGQLPGGAPPGAGGPPPGYNGPPPGYGGPPPQGQGGPPPGAPPPGQQY
jgi:hypothetical protein